MVTENGVSQWELLDFVPLCGLGDCSRGNELRKVNRLVPCIDTGQPLRWPQIQVSGMPRTPARLAEETG